MVISDLQPQTPKPPKPQTYQKQEAIATSSFLVFWAETFDFENLAEEGTDKRILDKYGAVIRSCQHGLASSRATGRQCACIEGTLRAVETW